MIFVAVELEILLSSARHRAARPHLVVSAGATLPFAWRRTHTVVALTVVVVCCFLDAIFLVKFADLTSTIVVPLLLGYTVGTQFAGRASWIGLALSIGAACAITGAEKGATVGDSVFIAFYVAAAWYIGRGLRARAELNDALRDKALRIDAAREETARAAVAAERARIARELHDVVAHASA